VTPEQTKLPNRGARISAGSGAPYSGETASIKENSYNRWLKGLSAEQRQKIRELYQQLYEQPPE
jgi:hypothetical protein